MQKAKNKVGFVFDDTLDSYDGVAQYVKTLGTWLSLSGYEVRYLVGQTKMSEWSGGKVYSLAKNQKVTFNGNQARIPLPANAKRIKEVLDREQFDVLHVQAPYSPFLAQKIINRVPDHTAVVGTFHVAPSGVLSDWGGHLLHVMYMHSLRRFDKMLSVSPAAADYAKSAFGLSTEVLPNVVEISKFKEAKKKKLSEYSNSILFFGRLVKRKGAKELLQAFHVLALHNPDVRLIIAGAGPERESLQNEVKRLKLQNRVSFLGFIKEEDKANLLASADIVCYPSTGGESFGIVLLEAMASGAGIVIGGDNAGYRSVLGKQSQLLFDPKNSAALAAKLSELLKNKEMVMRLHTWQQKEVEKYDVSAVGPKLVKIYEAAIAKRAAKRDN
jgi:phosphatidylinositol alpha-mannosyltransferase